MTALVGAILVASLLGSVHCAGMCGAFLAFAVSPDEGISKAGLNGAYNLGRLCTYVTLGALAGAFGAAVDIGGAAAGVQRCAAVLAGAMMVGLGGVSVARAFGVTVHKAPIPGAMQRLAIQGHRAAALLPPLRRAAAIGLLTTLLPCGWLYAFVITAAGTASPLRGALAMGAFWLGTLPVMIGLGVGVQALTGRLRRHLPLATALLVIGVGLWTIVGRVSVVGAAVSRPAVGPADAHAAIERVHHLEAGADCPLCK